MGRTPQRFPGQLIEEDSIFLEDRESDPDQLGTVWRKGDSFFAQDGSGKFNLRQGAGVADNRYLIFKTDGGLVYDSNGDLAQKENDS